MRGPHRFAERNDRYGEYQSPQSQVARCSCHCACCTRESQNSERGPTKLRGRRPGRGVMLAGIVLSGHVPGAQFRMLFERLWLLLHRSRIARQLRVALVRKREATNHSCHGGRETMKRHLRVRMLALGVMAIANMARPATAKADEEACWSGGPGSSSCSISGSCSVSCREGYYACCDTVGGCWCVAES